MKKVCTIFGILLIIIGILALLTGGLFWYASMHTMDGSAGLYAEQRRLMLLAFLLGVVFTGIGIALLIIRKKNH